MIKGIDGSSIAAIGVGSIKLRTRKGTHIILQDVLFTPHATLRLISIGKLADDDMSITFKKDQCTVKDKSGKTVVEAYWKECGLYTLMGNQLHTKYSLLPHAVPTTMIWHK